VERRRPKAARRTLGEKAGPVYFDVGKVREGSTPGIGMGVPAGADWRGRRRRSEDAAFHVFAPARNCRTRGSVCQPRSNRRVA